MPTTCEQRASNMPTTCEQHASNMRTRSPSQVLQLSADYWLLPVYYTPGNAHTHYSEVRSLILQSRYSRDL
eukprot:1194998-Prorocentrum_minimum.AAC.5